MAKKRKMVQHNLLRNSIAAYFAAIEIHNKPNIFYRYETVTLLLMNAWELVLKAYIRKHIKTRTIFEDNGHTIPLSKALIYAEEHINQKKAKSFTATKENLFLIEEYRNNTAHFYNESLEPQIFMLVARAALNYVEFIKVHFSKDIIKDEGLFIMPLGFKLPFRPEDFLTKRAANSNGSIESKKFIESIVKVISDLKENDVEESIVLGFDIYLESIKKASNSDLLVAITSQDTADASFSRTTSVRLTDDPNAPVYSSLSDDQFRSLYPHNHADLVEWCKTNINNFSQGYRFNDIKRELKKDKRYANDRRLDSRNPKSASQCFYSVEGLNELKRQFEERPEGEV